MENKYFKKIVGTKCYLSPIHLDDAVFFTEWLSDFSVYMNQGIMNDIINIEGEKEILRDLSKGYHLAIIDKEKNKLIGSIGLKNIDLIRRTAEFGILIGERNFWNRGYGTEASKLFLDYCFNVLNFHHIRLGVFSFNKRAIKCYEKVGFIQVGKYSEYIEIAGVPYDLILMELLAKNFISPLIKKAFEETIQEKPDSNLELL